MPWNKVDDEFTTHPKLLDIPREHRTLAIALWLAGANWSARKLTDGFVHPDLPFLEWESPEKRLEAAIWLVVAGLWHEVTENPAENAEETLKQNSSKTQANHQANVKQTSSKLSETVIGWEINDWKEYNPTAAEVMRKRKRLSRARSESGRKGGKNAQANHQAKLKQTSSKPPSKTQANVKPRTRTPTNSLRELSAEEGSAERRQREVFAAYRRRYIEARPEDGDWQLGARHYTDFLDVARACIAAPEPFEQALDRALDNFFADDWAIGALYPPANLAKYFGKYLNPPDHSLNGPLTATALAKAFDTCVRANGIEAKGDTMSDVSVRKMRQWRDSLRERFDDPDAKRHAVDEIYAFVRMIKRGYQVESSHVGAFLKERGKWQQIERGAA